MTNHEDIEKLKAGLLSIEKERHIYDEKGNEYSIIDTALLEENEEACVIYQDSETQLCRFKKFSDLGNIKEFEKGDNSTLLNKLKLQPIELNRIYIHVKTQGRYLAQRIVFDENTEEIYVQYESSDNKIRWLRKVSSFLEPIMTNNENQRTRFELCH